jgi:hypothetical protein
LTLLVAQQENAWAVEASHAPFYIGIAEIELHIYKFARSESFYETQLVEGAQRRPARP